MLVMAFDLETTGLLEDESARVTEMSYIIYDTEQKRDIKAKSFLVNSLGQGVTISEEITNLTGLNEKTVRQFGYDPRKLCEDFNAQVEFCSGITMARRGEMFDIPMMARMFELEGMNFTRPICLDDTLDLEYPEFVKGRTLSHIAADHGFLNMRPHSGLSDVMSMIGIMERGGYCWQDMLDSARSSIVEVIANVSYHDREKAKEAKFGWDTEEKKWKKTMRQKTYENSEFSFPTTIRPAPGFEPNGQSLN